MPVTDLKRRQPSYTSSRTLETCLRIEDVFPRDAGYKSILKKGVYFTNGRFRDILMEIAMKSKQTTIAHMVDNLDDMRYMMVNDSPVILALFENAFVETDSCKNTKHAYMTDDQYQEKTIAFPTNSPVIHEDLVNEKMGKRPQRENDDEGDDEDVEQKKMTNQNIHVMMLEVGWIYEETQDGRMRTAGDLMSIFDDASSQFIDTLLVRTFISTFWGSYFRAIVMFRLIPAVAYLVSTIGFFSYYLLVENEDDKGSGIHWEKPRTWSGLFCCLAILYHLVYEIL